MNIVFVKDIFLPTAGYQINAMAKWLTLHGHSVVIITGDDLFYWSNAGFIDQSYIDGIYERDREFTERTGVKVIRVHSYGRISSRLILSHKFISLVMKQNADIVYVHLSDSLTAMRLFLKAKKLPFPLLSDNHMVPEAVVNKHTDLFNMVCRRFITPILLKQHIPIITLTESTREFCRKRYGLPDEMLPLVELGTDTSVFFPSDTIKKEYRLKYNISEKTRVFIYTGKIIASKKVKLILDAIKTKIQADVLFVLVGEGKGEYYESVAKEAHESENKVLLFPSQEYKDLAPFYQMSDVAIIPGACSLSFFDEQACALPVIGEDIPVMRERVGTDNSRGALYTVDDWVSLRDSIVKYATMDEIELITQRKSALHFIEANYDYSMLTKKVEDLMEQLIRLKKTT